MDIYMDWEYFKSYLYTVEDDNHVSTSTVQKRKYSIKEYISDKSDETTEEKWSLYHVEPHKKETYLQRSVAMISVPYLVYAIDWLNIFDRLQQKKQGMGEGSVQWADLMSQVASSPEPEFLNF
jgi:hypothetical protein